MQTFLDCYVYKIVFFNRENVFIGYCKKKRYDYFVEVRIVWLTEYYMLRL